MRQKQPAAKIVLTSEQSVPYRLSFRTDKDGTPATLTSPLLDPAMHEREGALAYFAGVTGRKMDAPIRLDPFEAISLTTYLQNQERVRLELEQS